MRQTTLTESGARCRIIGGVSFSHKHSICGFVEIFSVSLDLSSICFAQFVDAELPLCIIITLSWNAITCFVESSGVQDSSVTFLHIVRCKWH